MAGFLLSGQLLLRPFFFLLMADLRLSLATTLAEIIS
jgi:hypothetical protein